MNIRLPHLLLIATAIPAVIIPAVIIPAVMPTAATAQDITLPQLLVSDSARSGQESQIVIRVRDFDGKEDACRTGFDLSRLGVASDGFDFPHPGRRSQSFGLPQSGNFSDFPRPGGSVSAFQLPVGSRSPQIMGCLDYQRNILFITIRPQVKAQPQPQPEVKQPQPSPTPAGQIMVPPSPTPQTPTPQTPTSFILLPQQPTTQNPNGFPSADPATIK
jgi:hypothetical protein